MKNYTKEHNPFLTGKVFGFDVGSGSIAWAVRKGPDFKDAGVLICESEGSDLSQRRELRRQRRTLRSRKHRRRWFSAELEKLGLSRPTTPLHDPILLRFRALNGEKLAPEELHRALTHLFKRRGYADVPWATAAGAGEREKDDETGVILAAVKEMREKLQGLHPCQYLMKQREEAGKSPTENWARKIYWPREALEQEFRAILKAQEKHYPKLAEKGEWLLYGDTRQVKDCHVYFKATEGRNPGVLGLKWPRFENRGPALDAFQPVDESGHPLHVVRKNKPAYMQAQWELALMNFRVLDAGTREKIDPRIHFPVFIENLRNEWNKKGKVTAARLKKMAEPFKEKFLLIEGQKPLTPQSGAGRARYSSPTLEFLRNEIQAGNRIDPPQPILRRAGESAKQALDRYLSEIKHPLVRHRLVLFRGLLGELIARFGKPDMIIVEAVRSLALGEKAKAELNKRNEEFRRQREIARESLAGNRESTSRKAILRYRLWQETKYRCPFCLKAIERTELGHGADIEHLVPRSTVDSNEIYNLTVAHLRCNRELKRDRTPFMAFSGTSQWEGLRENATQCFAGRKLEIFLSNRAEELIEDKADLQHTAYIARVIRHVALLELGWLNKEGKDPTPEKQNAALPFQVTNGHLTSRLRQAWGLNQILHPFPSEEEWRKMTPAEQEQKRLELGQKNRGDLRHHALDAIVISCTLPWLAHRTYGATDEAGNHGWWTQDEKQRSKAANPLGLTYKQVKSLIDKVVVRHHVSRSNHRQAYATTLYAKKAKDTYVARKEFAKLKPKDLGSIWPAALGAYCKAAWARYQEEASDIKAELKKTKECLPESFTSKLCFSHFQKWRTENAPAFAWPEGVKIPIRSVGLISVKDDTAVLSIPGTQAFVKRTGFKEVQIYLSADGKKHVPVFIPYWKGDKPICETPIKPGSRPITIIRRGMVLETKKPFSTGHGPGKYRVLVTGQKQLTLLPHHVANTEEAIVSFGLEKSGLKPGWPDFIRALGYELPHPSSIEPKSASSTET